MSGQQRPEVWELVGVGLATGEAAHQIGNVLHSLLMRMAVARTRTDDPEVQAAVADMRQEVADAAALLTPLTANRGRRKRDRGHTDAAELLRRLAGELSLDVDVGVDAPPMPATPIEGEYLIRLTAAELQRRGGGVAAATHAGGLRMSAEAADPFDAETGFTTADAVGRLWLDGYTRQTGLKVSVSGPPATVELAWAPPAG